MEIGSDCEPVSEVPSERVLRWLQDMFICMIDDVDSLENDFIQYLLEPSPPNTSVNLLVYWHYATAALPQARKFRSNIVMRSNLRL